MSRCGAGDRGRGQGRGGGGRREEGGSEPHSLLHLTGPPVPPFPLLQVEAQAGVDHTPMPELQHNLQLLVDMCESDIQRLDARLRHEQV